MSARGGPLTTAAEERPFQPCSSYSRFPPEDMHLLGIRFFVFFPSRMRFIWVGLFSCPYFLLHPSTWNCAWHRVGIHCLILQTSYSFLFALDVDCHYCPLFSHLEGVLVNGRKSHTLCTSIAWSMDGAGYSVAPPVSCIQHTQCSPYSPCS